MVEEGECKRMIITEITRDLDEVIDLIITQEQIVGLFQGEESEWGGGLLRIPRQFNREEWALSVWLNKTVKDGDLLLFPDYSGMAIDEPKFNQIRRFSTRSWYVTSDIFDAYGPNCLRLEDVDRRKIRARRWLSGLSDVSIANEGVKWVIIREDDIGKVPVLFKFQERYEVYNHIVFHI